MTYLFRVLASIVLIALLAGCGDVDARIDYWKSRIEVELPAGSSLTQVDSFLKSNQLEYHCYPAQAMCYGIEKAVENYLIVSYSAVMVFSFNEEHKLQNVLVNTSGYPEEDKET